MKRIPGGLRALYGLLRDTVSNWSDDYAPSMGAAIAYYTVFSVAPLLLIVISVAGIVFGAEAAQGAVVSQLEGFVGTEGARAIEDMLVAVSKPETSAVMTVVGFFTLLVGATTVFAELQSALDRIWRVPERHKSSGVWSLLRARVLSFGMILGIGFLLIVSLLASAGLAALSRAWSPLFGEGAIVAHIVDLVVSLAVVTTVFAMIYKIMPRANVRWPDVWLGAFVTALLFTIGKVAIGLYIGKSGVASGYGAAGSLVVLLLWVYYASQIFLLGAEFTWLYAHRFGSLRGTPIPEPDAAASRVGERSQSPPATPNRAR
ncbi:YihY/virulence factor BrkB family protein [Cupriavidus sp. AU9028]|uniref:YihY/virulence factor BrkB family protein n=1 Tax=Cupriavidus sp. AU9028 TaxID=2871157 RepID=UPI001C941A4D|nr:YihY/virulence factor BrkB family protein [Cupriavidus sp. AU9028]MBY4898603.1 YihY/virulence factor BrkB family protein [Cupriavidus sp. AU9028]